MIRFFGLSAAAAVTAISATGILAIVAADFVGEDGVRRMIEAAIAAANRPPAAVAEEPDPRTATGAAAAADASSAFDPRREIHFFDAVPIEGTDLEVSTGAAYATVADVEGNRPLRQWCYVTAGTGAPGIHRRIDLGLQAGDAPPGYATAEDLAGSDLEAVGLAPARLAALARSHCRFGRLDPLG